MIAKIEIIGPDTVVPVFRIPQPPTPAVRSQRGGEADPDATGRTAAGAPRSVQSDGDLVQRAPSGRQELLSYRGEGDPAGPSDEQRVPDLRLQAANLLAERRLCDAQPRRCVSEVEFLSEHREGVQLLESELGAIHTCRDIR